MRKLRLTGIRRREASKGISIRSSLFRNFSILIILVLISFSAVLLILQFSELSMLSRRLVMEATLEMESELQKIFQPVIKNINISAHWGRLKQYNKLESKEMLEIFIPILNEYDYIVRIKSIDHKGNGFSLSKNPEDDDEWITTRTYSDPSGTRTLISSWDDDLDLIENRWQSSGRDLRLEEWYQSSIDNEAYRLSWNEPYCMEHSGNLVMTASIKVESGPGRAYILAFDIQLEDLQEIMEETVLSENGIVFISTLDDKLIGISGNILSELNLTNNEIELRSIHDFDIPQVKDLIKDWNSRKRRHLSKVVYFTSGGDRWAGTIVHFPSKGIPILKIGMLAPLSDVMKYDVTRGIAIFIIFILALVFAVVMTKKMAKRFIAPVKKILEQSMRISQGDLRKGEPVHCKISELSQLADTHEIMRQALDESRQKLEDYSRTLSEKVDERTFELNKKSKELEELNRTLEERVKKEVAANLQKDQLMLRSARQAQMGEMLSMIAHQWRQPLSSISTITGNLLVFIELDNYNKEQFHDLLGNINEHAQFLSRTINDFRNFFNPNKKKKSVMLDDIMEQTINIVGRSLEYKSITLEKDYQFRSPIITYPNEITQVFLNIIKNAQDVIVEKKTENPRIKIKGYQDNNFQVIEIKDNAGGIPSEHTEKIFDPYFSTKDEKQGTGLGLYMSRLIIEKHCKGKLIVKNEDEGANFIISIPMLTEEEI